MKLVRRDMKKIIDNIMEKEEIKNAFKLFILKLENASKEERISILKDVYSFAKKVSNSTNYNYVSYKVYKCESYLKDDYITDIKTNLRDGSNVLNHIIYETRSMIYNDAKCLNYDDINLTDYCKITSNYIKDLCQEYEKKCDVIKIEPDLDNSAKELCGDNNFHYFNLIYINNESYLVDVTYKQFFKYSNNLKERNNIYGLLGAKPGLYMMEDEESKRLAECIISDGFVKVEKNVLDKYLNGFRKSYNNYICLDLDKKYDLKIEKQNNNSFYKK